MLTHTELAARIDDEGLRGEAEGSRALARLACICGQEFDRAKLAWGTSKPRVLERVRFKRMVMDSAIEKAKDEDLFKDSAIAVSFGIESIIIYLVGQLLWWLIKEWLDQ